MTGIAPTAEQLDDLAAVRDPELVEKMRAIYFEHGDRVGLRWLDHVMASVKNNAVEVIKHLRARDGDATVAAMNKGRTRFFALSAEPIVASDAWKVTMDDGRTLVVNPDVEAAALISPDAFERLFLDQHVGMTVQ